MIVSFIFSLTLHFVVLCCFLLLRWPPFWWK